MLSTCPRNRIINNDKSCAGHGIMTPTPTQRLASTLSFDVAIPFRTSAVNCTRRVKGGISMRQPFRTIATTTAIVLLITPIAGAITFGHPDNGGHPNVGALVDGDIAYCSG